MKLAKNYLEFLTNDQEHSVRLKQFNYFKHANSEYITIKFFKLDESLLEEDNPLVVETATQSTLINLLEDWHDFLVEKPQTIIMQREGDDIKLFFSYITNSTFKPLILSLSKYKAVCSLHPSTPLRMSEKSKAFLVNGEKFTNKYLLHLTAQSLLVCPILFVVSAR